MLVGLIGPCLEVIFLVMSHIFSLSRTTDLPSFPLSHSLLPSLLICPRHAMCNHSHTLLRLFSSGELRVSPPPHRRPPRLLPLPRPQRQSSRHRQLHHASAALRGDVACLGFVLHRAPTTRRRPRSSPAQLRTLLRRLMLMHPRRH